MLFPLCFAVHPLSTHNHVVSANKHVHCQSDSSSLVGIISTNTTKCHGAELHQLPWSIGVLQRGERTRLVSDQHADIQKNSICETTTGTKSYSGFVHLPPSPEEGRSYPVNTFFWFFEARNNPANAPLSLWIQGGPGAPSTPAAVGENGPCSVNIDSKTTTLNPWSWNTNVNMLYIDQPVQTGYSYDTLVNGTIDETVMPFLVNVQNYSTTSLPDTNATMLTGTFASQNFSTIPVSSEMAAVAMWHFLQEWTQE